MKEKELIEAIDDIIKGLEKAKSVLTEMASPKPMTEERLNQIVEAVQRFDASAINHKSSKAKDKIQR